MKVRQTFHKCLDIILKPLYDQTFIGYSIYIGQKLEWIFIQLAFILADLPEAATYCLTSKSANAKYSCHHCLVSKKDLSNTYLNEEDLIKRTLESMKEPLNSNYGADVSIVCLENSLWKLK